MSYEAEKAVIGCLMVNDWEADNVPFLKPGMFRSPLTGRLYEAITAIRQAGGRPDMTTVRDRISVDEIPRDVFERLVGECVDSCAWSGQAKEYAKIVLADYRADELNRALQNAHADGGTVDDRLSELRSELDRLEEHAAERTENAADAVEKYSPKKFTPNAEKPIRTRIRGIDEIIGGIERGNMVIIAARPSVGKSAIAMEMAINFAKSGKRCELFNLEMRNEETYDRMVAHESGIELSHIKWSSGFVGDEGRLFDEGNKSLEEMGDNLLMVDDLSNVSEIVARARRDKADVVVIDYAQLLKTDSAYRDRVSQVGEISRSIKLAANRLNIPFIVLAQLNRQSALAPDRKPSMSELRESGAWEQDADKIILLWNKDEADRSKKGVLVDKNRQGRTGETELTFDGAVMKFSDGFRTPDEPTPFDD